MIIQFFFSSLIWISWIDFKLLSQPSYSRHHHDVLSFLYIVEFGYSGVFFQCLCLWYQGSSSMIECQFSERVCVTFGRTYQGSHLDLQFSLESFSTTDSIYLVQDYSGFLIILEWAVIVCILQPVCAFHLSCQTYCCKIVHNISFRCYLNLSFTYLPSISRLFSDVTFFILSI